MTCLCRVIHGMQSFVFRQIRLHTYYVRYHNHSALTAHEALENREDIISGMAECTVIGQLME